MRKRIERLVREQVIQIGAWADPLKIGYQDYINMELQVSLAEIERVAERLAKLPEIFFLGLCTGRSNIFAIPMATGTTRCGTWWPARATKPPAPPSRE